MIIDFHTHIFPQAIRAERERFFRSEPDFELLYRHSDSKMAGAGQLIDTMDQQQVDKAVVFGFPWKNPDTYRQHNDYILASMARFPDRLIGFACFDPFGDGAAREAERCRAQGFAGIGELADYHKGFDDLSIERLEPLMALCREKQMPILLHVNEPIGHSYPGKTPLTLNQIFALINQYPHNLIVLAHWGGGIFFYHLAKRGIKENLKNIYFDTAASPFLYEPAIYSIATQIIAQEKILFGSDFPLLSPQRYFSQMKTSGLTATAIADICGNNAARLLNL